MNNKCCNKHCSEKINVAVIFFYIYKTIFTNYLKMNKFWKDVKKID